MAFSPFSIPLLGSALLLGMLAAYAWHRRRERSEATLLAAVLMAVAGWTLAYGLEIMGVTEEAKAFWEIWSVSCGGWIGPVWLLFALHYTGHEHLLTRRTIVLVSLPAIVSTLLSITNSWHGWVWSAVRLDDSGPFVAGVVAYGPWFWIHVAFTYSFLLGGIFLYVVHLVRLPSFYRRQSWLMMVSVLLPLLGNVLYVLKWVPVPGLDPGPFAFTLSGVLLFVVLFRYRLLDLAPVAQRTVLEHMRDGVVVINDEGLIVEINPAARHMLGLSDVPAIGQPGGKLLQPLRLERYDDRELAHDQIGLPLQRTPGESAGVLQDGGEPGQRWIEFSVTPLIDVRGALRGRLVVLHDVTVQVDLARMKDDFVSMVSHELRTPMTSILGFSRLIQKQFARNIQPALPPDDAKPQQAAQRIMGNLDIIISEGERLTRLVNEVLDLAKMEAGRTDWHMGTVALPQLVERSVDGMRAIAQDRGLDLSVTVPADLPLLYGDADRLAQVLTNLLSNAIKFTDHGRIEVCAFCVSPSEGGEPAAARGPATAGARRGAARAEFASGWPRVVVSVQDTGIGIAEAELERVFDKFSQAGRQGGGDRGPGTGLGLSICRQIVEHHGGSIWAESQVGVGSRFSFSLPLSTLGEQRE